MPTIESLIIVGSSGSGKSTLVDGLREPQLERSLVIPCRFTTRPERSDDISREIQCLDRAEFDERVSEGSISPLWDRTLDIGQPRVLYGFETVAPEDERLRIYSANNAFLQTKNESVSKVIAAGVIVAIAATKEVRATRLAAVDGMTEAERSYRLNREDDRIPIDQTNDIIYTNSRSPINGQQALLDIVIRILNERES